MTLDELYDRVPWNYMTTTPGGLIRHQVTDACPICAAFGKTGRYNTEAYILGAAAGLGFNDIDYVINAADNQSWRWQERSVRKDMLSRMGLAE